MPFQRDRLPDPQSYFESQGLVLQKGRRWRTTSCPFHGGSDSLRVNVESGAYCCMAGCGARGGDVVSFEMALRGVEFVEAVKALGCWVDEPRPPNYRPQRPLPFRPRDALEVLRQEAILTAVAAGNIAMGVELSDADRARVLDSARRIIDIVEAVAT